MDYEKLGAFYLGRTYDSKKRSTRDDLLLYDSKDLVTHAACFGMTGSGKTGLCVVLLEEAAIDGIPAIIVDPKGDLSNLLLTFPELRGEDFAPWIPEGAAQRKGLSTEAYAGKQAALWREGLAQWGEDGERIRRLRQSADFAVYTPGSEAGLPVSLLKSFDVPAPAVVEDRELLRERIQATVISLLGLLGLDADPVRSREHILLSLIFDRAWQEGRELDLAKLIMEIQNPPVKRVGVLDLDAFYPAKDRFELAMTMNNVLASPGFEAWLTGEPLNLERMLYTDGGKPRHAIFSIAHLGDAERMFFVSTLLNQTVSWMRRQSGTTSLRALLYMDEIAGYLPPVANPPSKGPMMTLLKQARAFGLGVVLSTQNPKDIDYKAMSNMGTWFVGRLQTDRDQDRVLDGLAGAVAGTGGEFDRQGMEATLAGLGKRVFLMYNVHEDGPEVFHTRWALSYLPGPLTRAQIKTLTAIRKAGALAPSEAAQPVRAEAEAPALRPRPVLPPEVKDYFVPVRQAGPAGAMLSYAPALAGFADVGFHRARPKCDGEESCAFWTPVEDSAAPVDWEDAKPIEMEADELETEPYAAAGYDSLPKAAAKARSYTTWNRRFVQWLYTDQRKQLFKSPSLGMVSELGETEGEFRSRLGMAAREERDRLVEKLRKKYEPKIRRIEERIRRAEAVVEREAEQSKRQKLQSTISIGASLLGALFGRKLASRTNIGKAGTAVRSINRASKEAGDVQRAKDNVEAFEQQLADLEAEFAEEARLIEERVDPRAEEFETIEVRPKKSDISTKLVALVWLPYWADEHQNRKPAW